MTPAQEWMGQRKRFDFSCFRCLYLRASFSSIQVHKFGLGRRGIVTVDAMSEPHPQEKGTLVSTEFV